MAKTAAHIHQPQRSRLEVADRDEMFEFLEGAYGVTLRLSKGHATAQRRSFRHSRTDVGAFAIEEIDLPGGVHASPDPLNRIVALWAKDGRVEGNCDGVVTEAGPGDVTVVAQPDLPHDAFTEDVRVTSVLLDPAVVAGVALGVPRSHAPAPMRFSSFRPVDAAAMRLWKDTVSYLRDSVLTEDVATELVLGHASRLLAAVTLSTFPNSAVAPPVPQDRTDHQPVLLRRAIEYMDTNAGQDIALADIAGAVHVTPRAVQYMFRRHLDTTPLQYLRRLRLHYARQDLLVGDRAHHTVTAIAAKWGFVHTGRFAVLYRQTYGQSPHATLRS